MESWEQERNIGNEWYEYASKENENYFVKFMMYWVAFNWLYEGYRKDRQDEKLTIQNFLDDEKRNLNALESLKFFKIPQYQKAIAILTEEPIIDARTCESKSHYKNKVVNNESILDLIYIIYQIRCNLFHGSKSPSAPRNRALVEAAATILDFF